tara:strand:+ start:325 stop:606 length:282 start_codon:yes stop_codon:yes gene_type:complete
LPLDGAAGPPAEDGIESDEECRNEGGGADDHEAPCWRDIGDTWEAFQLRTASDEVSDLTGDESHRDRHDHDAQRAQRGEEGEALVRVRVRVRI